MMEISGMVGISGMMGMSGMLSRHQVSYLFISNDGRSNCLILEGLRLASSDPLTSSNFKLVLEKSGTKFLTNFAIF